MSNENLPYEEDTGVYEIATCSEYTQKKYELMKEVLIYLKVH